MNDQSGKENLLRAINDTSEKELICMYAPNIGLERIHFLTRTGTVLLEDGHLTGVKGASIIRMDDESVDTKEITGANLNNIKEMAVGDRAIEFLLNKIGHWNEGMRLSQSWNDIHSLIE